MREHLETSEMKPFPVIRDRKTGAASNLKINVYCYCKCPDDGTQMVQCKTKMDKDWLHVNCIDTPIRPAPIMPA